MPWFRFLPIYLFFLLDCVQASDQWLDYPGYDIPGYGRKVVLISGCQEYRSEETLPQLARMLAQHHGFDCRVLFTQDPANPGVIDPEHAGHIPGLEALETADLLIISARFLNLPDEQMQQIDDYLRSGRPVLGLRTSNHGFHIPAGEKWAHYDWQYEGNKTGWHGGFGQVVFGGKFIDHHGHKNHNSTRGILAEGVADLPVMQGLDDTNIWGPTFVYGINTPLREGCEVLVWGQVLEGMEPDSAPLGPGPYEHSPKSLALDAGGKNDPMMPLAWTTEYRLPGGRRGVSFHTTLGASQDFESEGVRRLIVNGVYYLIGINPKQGGTQVDLIGDYETTDFEFRRGAYWQQRGLRVDSFAHEIQPKSIDEPLKTYLNPNYGRDDKLYAGHPVNRFRFYDFYTRQAEAMLDLPVDERPDIYPDFPGLDGSHFGHWGAYHKNSFDDQRHNSAAISSAVAAAYNPHGVRKREKYARTIAFRLPGGGDISAVFDTDSLQWIDFWKGDFVRFHPHRWGLGHGMWPKGERLVEWKKPMPEKHPDGEFLGYYQVGDRNWVEYRIGENVVRESLSINTKILENGSILNRHFDKFNNKHQIAKSLEVNGVAVYNEWDSSFKHNQHFGPDLWPWVFKTKGTLAANQQDGYAHDTIPVPHQNPYGAPMLLAGIGFFSNGRAAVSTMFGDVWIVDGLDDTLENVTWKRYATGLNHALGCEVIDDKVIVLGRDRLTRLHDYNDDGCADYYENYSEAFEPSHGGHSFYVGLQKDRQDNLYFTASTRTVRVDAGGKTATYLNEGGQRNPNGVGASLDGIVLTSANEGDWNPASLIWEVQDGDFCGRNAKPDGPGIAMPMAFVPRGIDNSTGSQIFVEDDRWGMRPGTVISTSFGSGTIYGLLRDTHWDERTQGAVFPLPFDFASGTHRAKFAPHDGQLYLIGADGWGNYATNDGCLDRLRYTGKKLNYPAAWRAHQNGLVLDLHSPIDPASVKPENFLLQQWHYQFSEAYGCNELSLKSPGAAGHDPVELAAVSLSDDGTRLYLSIPEIHPIECLHVHARLTDSAGEAFLLDTFHTLLHLDSPHPQLATRTTDLASDTLELDVKFVLGGRDLPWTRNRFPEGTSPKVIDIESLAGLKFDKTLIEAKAGEPLQINFKNVDPLMPHNLVFVKPGQGQTIGLASNALLAKGSAGAAEKHYVPESEDVLFHTSVLVHNRRQSLYVHAPTEPGDYPYLCTFPGHWGVMQGILRVNP